MTEVPKATVKAGEKSLKLILFALVVLMSLINGGTSVVSAREGGFIDADRIMLLFGFPAGRFDMVVAGDMQLDYEIESQIGRTEGESSIDTAEEFITAAFLSRVSLPESGRREFDKELPTPGDGALRLCAMWLFKTAEYPARVQSYRSVLSLIRKKTAVSDDAIVDYYMDALARRMGALRIEGFHPREEEHLRRLMLMYMMDPVNTPPAAEIRKFIARLTTLSPEKAKTALKFISAVSPVVAARFEEKSGARRG